MRARGWRGDFASGQDRPATKRRAPSRSVSFRCTFTLVPPIWPSMANPEHRRPGGASFRRLCPRPDSPRCGALARRCHGQPDHRVPLHQHAVADVRGCGGCRYRHAAGVRAGGVVWPAAHTAHRGACAAQRVAGFASVSAPRSAHSARRGLPCGCHRPRSPAPAITRSRRPPWRARCRR